MKQNNEIKQLQLNLGDDIEVVGAMDIRVRYLDLIKELTQVSKEVANYISNNMGLKVRVLSMTHEELIDQCDSIEQARQVIDLIEASEYRMINIHDEIESLMNELGMDGDINA